VLFPTFFCNSGSSILSTILKICTTGQALQRKIRLKRLSNNRVQTLEFNLSTSQRTPFILSVRKSFCFRENRPQDGELGVSAGVGGIGVTVGCGRGVSVGGGDVRVGGEASVGPEVGVGKGVFVDTVVGVLGGVLLGCGTIDGVAVNQVGLGVGVKAAGGRGVTVGRPCGGGWNGT
jgi:hypothetical protein